MASTQSSNLYLDIVYGGNYMSTCFKMIMHANNVHDNAAPIGKRQQRCFLISDVHGGTPKTFAMARKQLNYLSRVHLGKITPNDITGTQV